MNDFENDGRGYESPPGKSEELRWNFTGPIHVSCPYASQTERDPWTYPNTEDRSPLLEVPGLPSDIRTLCNETSQAFRNGAFILAAAGIRAVVESICRERNCRGANLQQKIKKLNGVLSIGDIRLLQIFRAQGNSAIHQAECPSLGELAAAIDVLEHLLRTLYVLPGRASEFKNLRGERIHGHSLSLVKAS